MPHRQIFLPHIVTPSSKAMEARFPASEASRVASLAAHKALATRRNADSSMQLKKHHIGISCCLVQKVY